MWVIVVHCGLSLLFFFQALPGVGAVSVASTVVPLIGVLAVTAIKDAYDDIVRG